MKRMTESDIDTDPRNIPVIGLAYVDDGVFELFVKYLYSGKLAMQVDKSSTEANVDEWKLLCKLWIFGKHIGHVKLQNDVMDTLLHIYDEVVHEGTKEAAAPPKVVDYVYRYTKTGSKLRRFVVDTFVWACRPGHLDRCGHDFVKAFYRDLAAACIKELAPHNTNTGICGTVNSCDYHEHVDGAICGNDGPEDTAPDGELEQDDSQSSKRKRADSEETDETPSEDAERTIAELSAELAEMQNHLMNVQTQKRPKKRVRKSKPEEDQASNTAT